MTEEFCSNIENHTDTAEYDAVEKEVVSFNNVISLAENLIPILFSFYIGSWSDRFGRKEGRKETVKFSKLTSYLTIFP